MNNRNRYTKFEDETILRVFPVHGYEGVAKALPKRTLYSIRSRVGDLREKGHELLNPTNTGRPLKAREERTRKRRVSMVGMSRHDRYMAGESVGCV